LSRNVPGNVPDLLFKETGSLEWGGARIFKNFWPVSKRQRSREDLRALLRKPAQNRRGEEESGCSKKIVVRSRTRELKGIGNSRDHSLQGLGRKKESLQEA